MSEFSEAERSCVVDKVEDSYLGSIRANPYSFVAPEEVWAGFIQSLGQQSLLKLVLTGYRGGLSSLMRKIISETSATTPGNAFVMGSVL